MEGGSDNLSLSSRVHETFHHPMYFNELEKALIDFLCLARRPHGKKASHGLACDTNGLSKGNSDVRQVTCLKL